MLRPYTHLTQGICLYRLSISIKSLATRSPV
jgi:hypothetical protein